MGLCTDAAVKTRIKTLLGQAAGTMRQTRHNNGEGDSTEVQSVVPAIVQVGAPDILRFFVIYFTEGPFPT